MTELDVENPFPRYVQVAMILEKEIRQGIWEPGGIVPSQVQLRQRFGISTTTGGKAHRVLAERGLVTPVSGVGMVVLPRARWAPPEDLPVRTAYLG